MARNIERENLPLPNRNLYDLVKKETGGNISEFAKRIGCSQQMLDNLFRYNEKQGKYPSIYPSVKNAVLAYFNFEESWFFTNNEEPKKEEPKSLEVEKLLNIINNLIQVEERNSKANLLNAEANKINAANLDKLLNSFLRRDENI